MEPAAAKLIGAGLATLGMGGAGIGLGLLFGSYLQAAIRNPTGAAGERIWLFVGIGLTESMGIFALVISFMILFS
ncbi:MAG TPA: F0F1 ATP synthase subunit C [Caulobacteraceae bacterium]|nr:F0F1 ATP synthase subunit C [Caulobacteraceae bacterium]